MGADYPDWGGQYNSPQFFPLFDQAELAARLGSPVFYDRRGSVIWYETFEYGLAGVVKEESGAGSSVYLSSTFYEQPPFSAVLEHGPVAGRYAQIYRRVAIPQSKNIGFAASIKASASASLIRIEVRMRDGATSWETYLKADLTNKKLYVLTEGAVETEIDAAIPDLAAGYYFAHFKIVVDFTTKKLVRAMLDDVEYDLSAYTISSQASALAPHLLCLVRHESDKASTRNINVDNLIISAAEPPNS
jgi:hypothetical protein